MSEKIFNVAFIGCSGMAKLHIDGAAKIPNVHLYAICGIDEKQLAYRLEEHKFDVVTRDYNDLVNDPKVDVAVIITPDQLHVEMATKFMKAGKAVLCEKPMALTVEECEEMMRVEKETGAPLMVGQIARCSYDFRKAKELIDEGRIGELTFVESEYAHNYEKARGFADWRVVPERHGFIGGGCHAVDLLRWIAGDPTEVTAYANNKYLTDWPVDDNTIAIFKFPNNVIGKVFVSIGCKRPYTMRSVFYGTKGTIICESKVPYIKLYETNEELGRKYADKEPIYINVTPSDHNTEQEMRDFIAALTKGEPSPVSSYDGASTVAVCCAAVESTKTGAPVKIRYPKV